MIDFLHRWVWTDLWAPMWPNVFAPSAPTLFGVLVAHLRLKAHVTAQTNQHCDGCTCAGERP